MPVSIFSPLLSIILEYAGPWRMMVNAWAGSRLRPRARATWLVVVLGSPGVGDAFEMTNLVLEQPFHQVCGKVELVFATVSEHVRESHGGVQGDQRLDRHVKMWILRHMLPVMGSCVVEQ